MARRKEVRAEFGSEPKSRRIIGRIVGTAAHLECEYCRAPSGPGGDLIGDAPSTDAQFSTSISERSSVEYAADVSCAGRGAAFGREDDT